LQVVVEVYRASTQVATEESSVGGEDGGYVDVALLAKWYRDTSQPLVELYNDSSLLLMVNILQSGQNNQNAVFRWWVFTSPRNHATRYPKTIASLVSASPGGEGMPAVDQRSPFHSSSHR
jgi:hypothetical protein